MDIRKYKQEELAAMKMETVDGVHAPAKELAEAMAEADKNGKTQFVGTYYERNPECKDAEKPGYNPNRIRMTGKFILTDRRDDLYQHQCDPGEFLGGLVGLPPSKDKSIRTGERRHHELPEKPPAPKKRSHSDRIRSEGIAAPGESKCGDPTADNLGMLCGIGLEIAAQLAELNERLEANGYPLAGPVHLWPKGKPVEQP